jgi:hypothetical protein
MTTQQLMIQVEGVFKKAESAKGEPFSKVIAWKQVPGGSHNKVVVREIAAQEAHLIVFSGQNQPGFGGITSGHVFASLALYRGAQIDPEDFFSGKKTILYAPSFRDSPAISDVRMAELVVRMPAWSDTGDMKVVSVKGIAAHAYFDLEQPNPSVKMAPLPKESPRPKLKKKPL